MFACSGGMGVQFMPKASSSVVPLTFMCVNLICTCSLIKYNVMCLNLKFIIDADKLRRNDYFVGKATDFS